MADLDITATSPKVMISDWLILALFASIGPIIAFATKGIVLWLALIGILSIIGLVLRPESRRWSPSLFTFTLFLISVWASISLLWSVDADKSWGGVRFVWSVWLLGLPGFIYVPWVAHKIGQRFFQILAFSLVVGGCFSLALGLLPNFIEMSGEGSGTDFERHVSRALYFVVLSLFVYGSRLNQKHGRLVWVGLLVFLGLSLFTTTQTVVVAMAMGLVGVLFCHLFARYAALVLTLVCSLYFAISVPLFSYNYENNVAGNILGSVNVDELVSSGPRSWMYAFFADEIQNRPILGHGIRVSKNYMPTEASELFLANPNGVRAESHPHNVPLQILFDLGAIGALLTVLAIWAFLQEARQRLSASAYAWIFGFTCALIGLGLFSTSIWAAWFLIVFVANFLLIRLLETRQLDLETQLR
jgi:O-antigen ligase